MRGEFASVRLPRRMVPICVSEPIGLASPLRIASTPAIVVVLTAPRPTSMIPSFPSAFSMVFGCFTIGRSYSTREDVEIWKCRNRVIWGNGNLSTLAERAAGGDDGGREARGPVPVDRRARSGARRGAGGQVGPDGPGLRDRRRRRPRVERRRRRRGRRRARGSRAGGVGCAA